MWKRCPDALICDLAEVYHIYDPAAIPCRRLAVYACGLPENSRVFMYLAGRKITTDQMLQAAILDRLSMLVWMKTADAAKGRNRPQSILANLMKEPEEKEQMTTYDDAAAFEAARQKFFKGGG